MKKEEFVKGMTYLGIAIGKKYTQEELNVYYDFVNNYQYNTFIQAIKNMITKGERNPNIHSILSELKTITTPELQYSAKEEWENVLHALRYYGYYKQEEAMASLKPITRECVQSIGWYRLCMSEEIQWERKLFIEIFENKQYAIEHNPQMLGYAPEKLLENKEDEQNGKEENI